MDASSETVSAVQQLLSSSGTQPEEISQERMVELITEQVKSATKQFRDISLPRIEELLQVSGFREMWKVRGVRVYLTSNMFTNLSESYQWYVDRDGQWYQAEYEQPYGRWERRLIRWTRSGPKEFLRTIVRVEELDPDDIPLKVLADVCQALLRALVKGEENARQRQIDLAEAAASQREVLAFIAQIKH